MSEERHFLQSVANLAYTNPFLPQRIDLERAALQQDFVPGLVIPLQFTATTVAKKEIVCTQLCGLGHFNMRAYLEVMPDSQFMQWLKDQANF